MSNTQDIQIGDFIEIPSWKMTGMIIEISNSLIGNDSDVMVKLQINPDKPRIKKMRLSNDEFKIIG